MIADTGTYQANPDCSGSADFPTNNETVSFNIVDSKSLVFGVTTPGGVGSGTFHKQQISTCNLESLRGAYIFAVNGVAASKNPPQLMDGFFPVSVVGNWLFDGRGGVSRSLSVNFGGAALPYADSGTYQVNSDCTGSAYFPTDAEPLQLIFVDSKNIVLAVVTAGRAGVGSLVRPDH
jgi:hypothetical protein